MLKKIMESATLRKVVFFLLISAICAVSIGISIWKVKVLYPFYIWKAICIVIFGAWCFARKRLAKPSSVPTEEV